MNVGVVAYELEGERTGVGRYLEGLLRGVREHSPGWTWFLFLHGPATEHELWKSPEFHPVFAGSRIRPIIWEQLQLPNVLRSFSLDLLFSPGYSLPPRLQVPSIVTLHDLSFELMPLEFGWRECWRRRILARRAARSATRILVDTKRMRDEIRSVYRLDSSRIGVVPVAIDARFLSSQAASDDSARLLSQRYGIESPYLLFLGTILPRRNIGLLLRAFAALRASHPDLRLVLAGAERLNRSPSVAEMISRLGLEGVVVKLGYVEEALVPALYANAESFVYLSSYEGFGLPPLESLACGTPAVVAPGMALEELWPDYPYRCSRLEVDAVVSALRRTLEDREERQRIVRQGLQRMGELSWKRSAALFLQEIETAIRP